MLKKIKNYYIAIFAVFLFSVYSFAQIEYGSGTYRNPYADLYSGSPLQEFHADVLDKNKPAMMKDTLIVDFGNRNVTFSRIDKLTEMPVWQFHYSEIEDYLRDMETHARNSLWNEYVREKGKFSRKDNYTNKSGLTFAVPARLPRWATRILGQEPPKLAITGSQKILFGVSVDADEGTRDKPGKKRAQVMFQPTSDFNIKGSVGRLLHLEINLKGNVKDSDFFDQARDQLSQVKIHYREETPGELEDDIIQEVEIGKTNFQMPGQGLAGYSSGSNENLFGIKVRSKLGPLELTTIASIENVETQHKTIKSNEPRTDTISELQYAKNQFFYIDDIYRQKAENPSTQAPEILTEKIHVYRKVTWKSPTDDIRYAYYKEGGEEAHAFKKLKSGVDYTMDLTRQGVIQFMSRLNESDVIGVVFEIAGLAYKGDTTINKVVINDSTTADAYRDLWVLKNGSSKIENDNYNLMLRNVYYIGTGDETDFTLDVLRKSLDGKQKSQNDAGEYFSDILGLSENGTISVTNRQIFDLENGYMFIPPFKAKTGENANWVFTNPNLGLSDKDSNVNFDAYDDSKSSVKAKYKIVTKGKKRVERFNLDFGIVEGSEKLSIGAGDSLIRYTDYDIDYGFGSVVLISPKALSADVIECDYQKESLFLLDKKVFIGINGKLDLPGIGRNSFLSTTLMWQLMDAKKMMPKVGTEPYNRFLFDSNLRLDFAPHWMTSAINLIPFIEREEQSSAVFDIETAYSSSKNSAKSNGEASIDNFSTSARTYSIGTSHTNWYRAAPDPYMAKNFEKNPPAWFWYWYEPAIGDSRTERREIYPLENTNNAAQTYYDKINTLKLVVQPYPEKQDLRSGISLDGKKPEVSPYAGISHGFSNALMDRSEDRYFEFWIKVKGETGKKPAEGMLFIDLGNLSEDISINGGPPNGGIEYETYSSYVTEATDLGLDKKRNEDEFYLYPNFTSSGSFFWDTLRYNDPRLGEEWRFDPSRDDYKLYDKDNLANRKYVNGTQGNEKADSKDIDGDGIVISAIDGGDYFRYKIDLKNIKKSPFYDKTLLANDTNSGWIHVRVPISIIPDSISNNNKQNFDVYGNPDWRRVRHLRMLWTQIEPSFDLPGHLDSLEFEGIQFVGNTWKEQVKDTSGLSGLVVASVLDSRSTLGYTYPAWKHRDSINGEQATDYTLRLEFTGVPADSVVLVGRDFEESQSMDLSRYRAVKFWAKDIAGKINNFNDNWFVLRFGNDASGYYEYKTRRLGENVGWDGEGFAVNLDDLTKLKISWFDKYGERDTLINTVSVTENGDSLRVYSETRIAPSLSNVSWIAFGIQNGSNIYSGDVRINGFRATGISDYSGWALRASMKLNWSDFIENSMDFKYTDADFRSMSDDIHKESSARISSGLGSKIQIDKFLPDRLGVQIPLGGNIAASMQRPQMRPNSDIKLNNTRGESDGLSDMLGDFGRIISNSKEKGEITLSEKYETRGRSRSAYTGYHKNKTSEKVIPRLTADRIGIDYRVNYRDSLARAGEVPENEADKIHREGFEKYHGEINTNRNHSMDLDYNFSPSKKVIETLSWSPLKNVKNLNLSKKTKGMSLNLLPERVMFDFMNVNYQKREKYNSIQDVTDTSGQYFLNQKPVEEVTMTHGFNMTYKPINPFVAINYNLGINRNFDKFIKNWENSGIGNFANSAVFRMDDQYRQYNVLFSEQSRNQDIKLAFTPEITRWLTFSANGGGGYSQNMSLNYDTTYMNTSINSSFDLSTQFNIRRLFEDFSKSVKNRENFAKGLSNIAKGFETVGFDGINFNYSASMSLKNSLMNIDYLDRGLDGGKLNYMLYSFGLFNRSFSDFVTGNMDDSNAFGGVQTRIGNTNSASDRRSTSQNYTLSTSLRIPKPVEISVNNMSLGWTRTYSITPEVDRLDTAIIFPDVRIGVSSSALEQLDIVKQNFSNFRLDWGYNYRLTNSRSGMLFSKIEKNHKVYWGFSPLIKTSIRLKKLGLDFSYSLDLGFDSTEVRDSSLVADEGRWIDTLMRSSQTKTVTNNWTAGYHVDGKRGRTIKLFRDQVIEIKGDIDYSLSIRLIKSYHRFYPQKNNNTFENEDYDDVSINIYPQMAYKFTKNVDARLFYELRRNITGKQEFLSHHSQFAMEVTISF
ncbi:MAG: cell surface protein SprA [Chitinispirillales bacterium]|nr:cell surface protein SprA [Chitinispirillales bacterium]